jgi:hypothetical protein
MLTGILIIAFSLTLLVYWFRYSCILLIRNSAEAVAAPVDSRFHVAEVQAQLHTDSDLDPLHAKLDRDYAMFVYLVEHAAGLQLNSIEDRLLVIDYRVMRFWYRLTHLIAPERSRVALVEMTTVMGILAGKIEHSGLHSKA